MLFKAENAKWVVAFAAAFAFGGGVGWFGHQHFFAVEEENALRMPPEMVIAEDMPEASVENPLPQETLTETMEMVAALQKEEAEKLANMPKWQKNSKPVMLKEGYAYVAIVIDDVGVVRNRSEATVRELPKEVTLAFLPYGESTPDLSKEAFDRGHEIMVHMPMQPRAHANGYVADPGPDALFISQSLEEVNARSKRQLASLKEISVGANNHMGSAFTAWRDGMDVVLKNVAEEKLMFMDSITTSRSQVLVAGEGKGIPLLKRDVFLDHSIKKEDIARALEKTVSVAKKQGYAIAIGHPHPETTAVLKEWVETLEDKKVQLVPITTFIEAE